MNTENLPRGEAQPTQLTNIRLIRASDEDLARNKQTSVSASHLCMPRFFDTYKQA